MNNKSDANGRRAEEYVLFGLAFVGCVVAASGVVVSSPAIAVIGTILTLFGLGCFLLGASSED